jgi:hypothetical protein
VTDKPISTESKDEVEGGARFVECRVTTGAELCLRNLILYLMKQSNVIYRLVSLCSISISALHTS